MSEIMNITNVNDDEGNALRAKIITMISLFSVSMVFGLSPMLISLKYGWFTKSKNSNMRAKNQFVVGLLSFGGGVLFATTFMHLLPEVDENIELLQEAGLMAEMPIYLAALIMCSGFFMMYLVEELVHVYINSRENKTANTSFTRVLSIRRSSEEVANNDRPIKQLEAAAHNHGHSHVAVASDDTIVAALRGLLIVLALSIHELFEGLAVGLESSARSVWYMFGAVSAHKYIIAFCIGVELLAAGTKRWLSIVYIFTFSFVSALGIGVGILLVGGAGATEAGMYSVVLQGLACGTLVYVVFFEVWRQDRTGIVQFVCSLLGFALMVGLEAIVEIETVSTMADTFKTKMSEFQQKSQKCSSPVTMVSLSAEFNSFKLFIMSALGSLQRQVEFLGIEMLIRNDRVHRIVSSVDHVEQHGQCDALAFSYHDLHNLTYKIQQPKAKSRILLLRNFGGTNLNCLRKDATTINWSLIHTADTIFNTFLIDPFNVHALIRPVPIKHLPTPGLSMTLQK
ncbi:zinc transporter ZIP1-like [Melitaea cinxia]|uniref:zinc transporter ZIP1-like n=1 Tax=Melitaea cinxia TaxID=113334 RepID=UPI001E27376F|nr:zinc transporter ZIP1-like [Melitaea cinxia]